MKHQILANPITILATVLLLNACGNQTSPTDISVSPTPTPTVAPTENVEDVDILPGVNVRGFLNLTI
ncbi:hypothetical protein IQ218_02480 [Synechocystis salina LEGE 06099]|uniref:hypothetical protein n=1 Tax=Synechocystis salina TaxID=945780 RepID=UPI00187FB181|nr:hypothetical protein [Synechocystis salina]MBE9202540.1 hypothetical protein [Synechocystis salina LEGE 06099]